MWVEYKLSTDEAGMRAAAYTTFCTMWKKTHSTDHGDEAHVQPLLGLPKAQCCIDKICQHTRDKQISSTNMKGFHVHTPLFIRFNEQVLKDAQDHINLATAERSYYTAAIEDSRRVLNQTFTVHDQLQVPPLHASLQPKSHNIKLHFSFDMAQQVNYI